MKNTLLVVLLAILSSFTARGQDIYLSTLFGQSIYKLNVDDCSVSLLVNHQIQDILGDITFHPNGNLYGVGLDAGGGLYQIDTLSGASSKVANFTIGFNAMITDSEGRFYLAGGNELYTYTLGGALIFEGTMDQESAGDLTFFDGELYLASIAAGLVRLDLGNPSDETAIVTEGVSRDIFGLVNYSESCDGTKVYGVSGGSPTVITFLDLAEGVGTDICTIDIGQTISGGASKSEFFAASPITLQEQEVDTPDCDATDGRIRIVASGGVGELSYSLDLADFQSTGLFENLPRASYTVYIVDETGCTKSVPIALDSELPFDLVTAVSNTECAAPTGSIAVAPQVTDWQILLNDAPHLGELPISELAAGSYTLQVTGPDGCSSDTLVVVGTDICPVYIPNVFSPNDDGTNDWFSVVTSRFFMGILSMEIYDRYGNKMYQAESTDGSLQWDGRCGGRLVETGVYVYRVTVSQADGQSATTIGDLTVLK